MDLGLGTLNETRAALGLTPYTMFAAQLIIGTTARDNIQGGPADDTLVASGNVQSVNGGRGNDTLAFDFGTQTTVNVHDFRAGDLLEIHGVDPAVNFSDVQVT